jgi:hypothetical protein
MDVTHEISSKKIPVYHRMYKFISFFYQKVFFIDHWPYLTINNFYFYFLLFFSSDIVSNNDSVQSKTMVLLDKKCQKLLDLYM